MKANNKPDETAGKHPFSADRPIIARNQDLLGRSGFAESLSSAIKGWKNKDSLVIGVYGNWGSGKTSLKNMITDFIEQDQERAPTIVEFNPWQWAGQDQLFSAFFSEIGSSLGIKDKTGIGKQRAKKWRSYAAYLKMGSFLGQTFRKLIQTALVIIGILGLGSAFIAIPWVNTAFLIVGLLAFAFAALSKWGEGFSEKLATVFEKRSELYEKGLSHLKKDLAKSLEKIEKPILVVIDDIDRLSKDETKLLFQLVKANADFPNMVYLLLFQRDIVEGHLESSGVSTGRGFLDKIVQVGFDLPRIERTRLEKVLFAGLDEILGDAGVRRLFDKYRWGNMFVAGLRDFFATLREVHRYLAMLAFHVALFKNKGSFEVNPVDLIALEVLRVFEPDVYRRIANSKFELTERRSSLHGEDSYKRTEAAVESILSQAEKDKQPYVRELIKQLFPYTENIGYGEGFLEKWFRDLRVCHPDVFDRYFHLTIPEGDISQAELDTILSLAGNRQDLVKEFLVLRDRNLIEVALDRLEAYKQEIDVKHAIPFITALFDIGDEISDESSGLLPFGAITHGWRILYWFLMKEGGPQRREDVLRQSIELTTGLYLPIDTISLEDDRQERKKDPNSFLVREEKLQSFIDLCVNKIRAAAESGLLENRRNMLPILYRWRKWTSPEEPGAWVQKTVESQSGAIRFLVALLQKSTSQGMGDYVPKEHWSIKLENVENFISSALVAEKIQGLDVGTLNENEQLAVRAFQKALERKEKGFSDDDWRHYDED
jgi:predicted KAP-like P-loop ATPase